MCKFTFADWARRKCAERMDGRLSDRQWAACRQNDDHETSEARAPHVGRVDRQVRGVLSGLRTVMSLRSNRNRKVVSCQCRRPQHCHQSCQIHDADVAQRLVLILICKSQVSKNGSPHADQSEGKRLAESLKRRRNRR